MFIEPGVFDAAHKMGIKYITDVNGDGRIDQQDIKLELEKIAVSHTVTDDQIK
jgi:uncharacterized protein (DUF2141 family)